MKNFCSLRRCRGRRGWTCRILTAVPRVWIFRILSAGPWLWIFPIQTVEHRGWTFRILVVVFLLASPAFLLGCGIVRSCPGLSRLCAGCGIFLLVRAIRQIVRPPLGVGRAAACSLKDDFPYSIDVTDLLCDAPAPSRPRHIGWTFSTFWRWFRRVRAVCITFAWGWWYRRSLWFLAVLIYRFMAEKVAVFCSWFKHRILAWWDSHIINGTIFLPQGLNTIFRGE